MTRLALILTTAVCCILRVALKLIYVDPATGFYEGGAIFYIIMNVLMTAGIIAALILGRKQKGPGYVSFDPFARIAGVLCGACALWIGISEGMQFSALSISDRACAVLAMLSGLILILAALRMGNRPMNSMLMLIPLVWQLILALVSYNRFTLILYVSDHRLSVLIMTFSVLFLLANGRILGNADEERGLWQIKAFAPPVFLLALPTACGYFASFIAGKTFENGLSVPYVAFFAAIGLYAFALYDSVKAAV